MNKLKIAHHSISDWDWSSGITKALDNAQYVSPPSSLKITGTGVTTQSRTALCRIASVQCVPQGEVRCWLRGSDTTWAELLIFRNQAALGNSDILNCYAWSLEQSMAYFQLIIAGSASIKQQFSISRPNNTWSHWRTIFWNGEDASGNDALIVQLFEEVSSVWVQRGTTYADTTQKWKTSATNRMGIGATERASKYFWYDDTELWIPE